MTDRIENDRQMHPAPGDASDTLVAQAYNLPQTDITIRQHYPQCHDQPHEGDAPGGAIQLGGNGGNSRSDAAATSSSRSDAAAAATSTSQVGDVQSSSTSQGGNASATGGDARSSANGGDGGKGGSSAVQVDNSHDGNTLVMDATQAPTVLPGAPPATSFEYAPGNGSSFAASSNGSIDSTSVGANLGLPVVGIGFGYGESRAANTEAVEATSGQQQTAFDVFLSESVDPALRLPSLVIQQGALNEVRRGQVIRAADQASP